ncbi:MAG: NADH-quinone oxidoreductase subunit M [Rhodospirillales bacterium]|jgi:NADH-quinone oxidoreductase subunit M|tara:strand:- start:6301 stop:7818 length:1518 start_codon:yes stop_codon:yes gene_type:complete
MNEIPLLSLLTFLPLIGAGMILFLARGSEVDIARNSRWGAIWTSGVTFVVSIPLWFKFDQTSAKFQFVEKLEWMPQFGISYHMGVDGISLLFVMLTTLLTPICILASWDSIKDRVKEFMISFLILETFMIGMFCALDLFVFYIFFEAVLIPMFIIIGVWGGPRRVYAAFKLFLYTLLGSVLMLVAMMAMYFDAGTTDMVQLMDHSFPVSMQPWLWLAFFASFAVKVPMWPVHTWLPDAHVEAPTAGSVILAGVLLKFGGYGFLRFSLPMFPDATIQFATLIFTLSIIAVIYTSLVALAQTDMKKLIAYSSIAHMGFVTAGTFTLTTQGIEGAIYQMLSHGVVSAALFLIVGVVYDRIHSREISDYGGLVYRMPAYSLVFMLFMLASVGLPGTGGFVGEILVLVGLFQVNPWLAAFAATGVILSAAYMLFLYRRIIFGQLTKENLMKIKDLNAREWAIFAPLIVLTLWMGIYPSSFLDFMHVSVDNLINQVETALAAHGQSLLAGR